MLLLLLLHFDHAIGLGPTVFGFGYGRHTLFFLELLLLLGAAGRRLRRCPSCGMATRRCTCGAIPAATTSGASSHLGEVLLQECHVLLVFAAVAHGHRNGSGGLEVGVASRLGAAAAGVAVSTARGMDTSVRRGLLLCLLQGKRRRRLLLVKRLRMRRGPRRPAIARKGLLWLLLLLLLLLKVELLGVVRLLLLIFVGGRRSSSRGGRRSCRRRSAVGVVAVVRDSVGVSVGMVEPTAMVAVVVALAFLAAIAVRVAVETAKGLATTMTVTMAAGLGVLALAVAVAVAG